MSETEKALRDELLEALRLAERVLSYHSATRRLPELVQIRAVIARAGAPTDDQFLDALGPCGR